MQMTKAIYNNLLQFTPISSIETGGILGGKDNIIMHCKFDTGKNSIKDYGSYKPDTLFLNQHIRHWSENGIAFYGIFHSHFPSSTELSVGDRRYISQIMKALSPKVATLYFPIVIPNSHMTAYRAFMDADKVQIIRDEIEIL